MRTTRFLRDELRRPVLESIWLPGTFLTLLWAFGFRCLFVAWLWFQHTREPSAASDASMIRSATIVTAIDVGLLLLLIGDGFTLWRRAGERGILTPWAAWCLAFGLLAIGQGATTAVDLTHRLSLGRRTDGEAHLADARRHLAHERFTEAKAAYEAAVLRDSVIAWWREYLWLLVAHPDDRMRDPEWAWRIGEWITWRSRPLDLDLGGALLAAHGDLSHAAAHLEIALTEPRASTLAPHVRAAIEHRLALYRAGRTPPREPPYAGRGWHEVP